MTAIRGVRWSDTNVAIITYLLASLESLKLKIKRLYLDRGFFSISVIRWLKALDIPFIMPAIRRGKKGGIRQFLCGRQSYKTTYTMGKTKDNSVTMDLWIICKYRKGKRGKYGLEYFAYVVHKVSTSLAYIHQEYRQRFGIESSYRLKKRMRPTWSLTPGRTRTKPLCRIRTTTKKPTLRLLYVGISFLLVNIWINILWQKISRPRKGGRLIYRELFNLKQMLAFLCQSVDRTYHVTKAVYLPSD